MKLIIPVWSSDMFNWKNGRGVADASDFKFSGPIAGRVYDDAIDVGFYVVSARTGVRMMFTEVFDEDGFDGEFRRFESGDYVITILND